MNVTRPKEKKNIFSKTFDMWEDKTKKQKSCLWLGHVCFCEKTFRDFFFMENSTLNVFILHSKTRLLLVSNDFDHEGQKMFVCVDGVNTKRKTNVTEPGTGFLFLCFVFSHVKSHRKNVFFFFWTCYIHIFWSLKVSTFFLLDLPFFAC